MGSNHINNHLPRLSTGAMIVSSHPTGQRDVGTVNFKIANMILCHKVEMKIVHILAQFSIKDVEGNVGGANSIFFGSA
jgi:hypothetical protein